MIGAGLSQDFDHNNSDPSCCVSSGFQYWLTNNGKAGVTAAKAKAHRKVNVEIADPAAGSEHLEIAYAWVEVPE